MREISAADMEIYRETARRNKALMQEKRDLRAKLAWEVAGKAAHLLRERFGAGKVMVFGSLLRPGHFDERSDVDLAAWGIPEENFLSAVAAVTGIDGEISVDLVRMEEASSGLEDQVREGVEL